MEVAANPDYEVVANIKSDYSEPGINTSESIEIILKICDIAVKAFTFLALALCAGATICYFVPGAQLVVFLF